MDQHVFQEVEPVDSPPPGRWEVKGQRPGFVSQNRMSSADLRPAHQVVEFRVLAEERLALLLLAADEVLDVHVEAGRGDAVGAQRGLLALLEQQRQQREQGMPARTERQDRRSPTLRPRLLKEAASERRSTPCHMT